MNNFRFVPDHIIKPEYVGKKSPSIYSGSDVQTKETIEKMRIAGQIAANAMHTAGSQIKDGMTTDQIDQIVHEFILDHNAYPSTLGYRGFPKSLCTSINEVICHGIPSNQIINEYNWRFYSCTLCCHKVSSKTNATIRRQNSY